MSDKIHELCELVREAGATMTLYGHPVTEDELRAKVGAAPRPTWTKTRPTEPGWYWPRYWFDWRDYYQEAR